AAPLWCRRTPRPPAQPVRPIRAATATPAILSRTVRRIGRVSFKWLGQARAVAAATRCHWILRTTDGPLDTTTGSGGGTPRPLARVSAGRAGQRTADELVAGDQVVRLVGQLGFEARVNGDPGLLLDGEEVHQRIAGGGVVA